MSRTIDEHDFGQEGMISLIDHHDRQILSHEPNVFSVSPHNTMSYSLSLKAYKKCSSPPFGHYRQGAHHIGACTSTCDQDQDSTHQNFRA